MAFQPEFTATASNIGYGWWSHDIGGHYQGTHDDELMARWTQLGVFSPILRLHSSRSVFNTREPWAYSEEGVITKALQFRHRLIPYLYTCAVIASTEYRNLVEPIYYDYPETPEAYAYKTQFTFGPALLVLPIVAPKSTSTKLGKAKGWLPPGRWVDIFTETVYDGDRVVSLHRDITQYPVLARQGAIIPLDAGFGNGATLPEAIEIMLVVGRDGSFDLVEDSGGEPCSHTSLQFNQAQGTLTITPCNALQRSWSVRLLSCEPKTITLYVDGQTMPTTYESGLIQLGKHRTTSEIKLDIGPNPTLAKIDHKPAIFKMLQKAQIGIDEKGLAWEAIDGNVLRVLGRLKAIGLDEDMREAMEELLLADLS